MRLLLPALSALAVAVAELYPLQQQLEQVRLSACDWKGEEAARGDEPGKNPLDDGFAAFIGDVLDRWRIPGLAVAVVDGEDTWAEGYGIAEFPSTPVTPSTLFYTGSTTKAFTAAIISLLISSGNYSSLSSSSSPPTPLTWQTPLSQLIRDDFVLRPEYAWQQAHLSLEDLLSHRTGFPRHDKTLARRYGTGADRHPGAPRDVARSLRFLPLVAEPRTTWRYCNLMYMVAAHAAQSLAGRWLGDLLRESIWAPLGMGSTYLSVEEALRAGETVARGYYWDYPGEKDGEGGGKGFTGIPYLSLDLASGAGGIVSNVLDYARWIRCLIRGDGSSADENGCPVLPPEAHRELKAARIALSPETRLGYDAPLAYALGWQLSTYKGWRVFTHGGGMQAYGTELYFLPDLGYGVVTMANTEVTSNSAGAEVVWKLIDDKLGIPEEKRYDWTSSGRETVETQLKLAETAMDDLYPERADPPLPRALPLEAYVGVYFHPAYQNVTIKLADENKTGSGTGAKGAKRGELHALRDDMEWAMTFDFHHVSGEFWAVVIDALRVPNMLTAQLARAEFVISVRGAADTLRMEFMEDGDEGIIDFHRIA